MGNLGGIEKVMVFGILVIILAILGIAVFSASSIDEEFPSASLGQGDGEGSATYFSSSERKGALFGSELLRNDVAAGSVAGGTEADTADPGAGGDSGTGADGELTVDEGSPAGAGGGADRSPALPAAPRTYTIEPGDTLSGISQKIFGSSRYWKRILAVNPGLDPDHLQVDQVINLPEIDIQAEADAESASAGETSLEPRPGFFYTIQERDTLCSIALRAYKDKKAWKKIYRANRDIIPNPDVLVVGTRIRIP